MSWSITYLCGELGTFIADKETTIVVARVYDTDKAALIAAAPDLLNLLEKFFLTVSAVEMGNKNMHGNNRHGVAPELLAEVKGLIEKAKRGA